jgi:hypothetical protein
MEMSIKKSLLALAVMALTLMGVASSAMGATDGVLRDTPGGGIIEENRELHAVGWASFIEEGGPHGITCHVTSVVKVTGSTGTTGHVSNFTVPNTKNCTGTGEFTGCIFNSVTAKTTPWHVTVTPTDFDVTPPAGKEIEVEISVSGFLCPPVVVLTLPSVTLRPLKTGTDGVTGTAGNLGKAKTIAAGEAIAGVELEGKGKAHITPSGTVNAVVSGELELTAPDRCTWKIAAS